MDTSSLFKLIHRTFYNFLLSLDIQPINARWMNVVLLSLLIFLASWLLHASLSFILTKSLRTIRRGKLEIFFQALIENRVIVRLTRLIPLLLIYNGIPALLRHFRDIIPLATTVANIFIIIMVTNIFKKIFRSITDVAETKPGLRDKPLESYVQVVNLIFNFIAIILVFSQVTGKEVTTFFTAMGAMSAVLLLVFKDTILGFVASIQVTTNDMVRIGDWVEMSKYGADGDVIEINLTTVKIQNFDKTITTIPTYSLISDSFKNWRGMKDTGGRRIKRSINIKMSSVRFVDEEGIKKYQSIQLLREFIAAKKIEIDEYNELRQVDKTLPVNGRNMTNLGLFRQYLMMYLQMHPNIRHDMTAMVRQLAPNEKGIPLEVYVFTTTIVWMEYEGIMADIFDHVIATAPYFDLEIFESISSNDKIHRQ